MNHKITASYLSCHTYHVLGRVEEEGEVVIYKRKEPKFVLMTMERYKEINND